MKADFIYNTNNKNHQSKRVEYCGNSTMFSIYFASAKSIGSLKFLPISCKLSGIPPFESLIGIDTAGIPIKYQLM